MQWGFSSHTAVNNYQHIRSKRMKDNKTEVLGFRLTQADKDALLKLAYKDSRTLANYISLIISKHIKESK